MDYQTLLFETPEPGLGVITLNRPDRLNAMNLQMLDDLYALYGALEKDDQVRVLILTGSGRGFCSGADLKDKRLMSEESLKKFASAALHLEHIQNRYSGVITGMRRLPQPVIAAVNGPAAGGGMCLALAADIIIAGPSATFIPSFINIGLSGGELGTTYFLPKMVGSAKAAEILMTGRTVNAKEADRIGLASCLAGEGELMNKALETARTLLGKTPFGLRMTKEAIRQNLDAPSLEAAVALENRNQSIGCTTPEFFQAVTNFSK
jgi:enoyl-CoA hydratase